MRKIVWLFGENEGRTLNNNSFYFWKQICSIDDEILKYYVVEKNDNNVKIVSTFSDKLKDKIVWKNSEEHIKVFNESDTHIVSLSYKDVTPTIYDEDIGPTKPTIYLQHGTTAIKKLGYKGFGYKNNFYKFIYYNKEMFNKFQKENDFKKYQLYYMIAHPRYMELVRRNNLKKKKRQFLYFLTWKEYLGDNKETRNLINNITNLVLNKDLVNYLKDNKITFKLCVHQFFDEKKLKKVHNNMDKSIFEIVTPSQIDVMDELANSELLITDFSSVGFDFTFLNKPVLLFAPDFDDYAKSREFYCDKDELRSYMYFNSEDIVKKIISGKYEINEFFANRTPKNINYKDIEKGKFLDELYSYLREKELNKVALLGYRFGDSDEYNNEYKKIAEYLLNNDYKVEFVSLRGKPRGHSVMPYGANEICLTQKEENDIDKEKMLRYLSRIPLNIGSLKYDNKRYSLTCDIKKRINNYLNNTTARTVISTRESIHDYLYKSDINNKIYLFYSKYDEFNKLYPGLNKIIGKNNYQNIVFNNKDDSKKYVDNLNIKSDNMIILDSKSKTSIVDIIK